MRRTWPLVAALVATAVLAGGCAGGDPEPATDTSAATATSTSAPTTIPNSSPNSSLASSTTSTPSTTATSAGTSPTTSPATTAPRRDAAALGFGEVAFTVTPSGGSAAAFCALLAETATQQARGLMGRRDLAGYDAMVFRFAEDTTSQFYMRNVPVPLSIAWFAADGRFVSSTDMAPCPDRDGCPLYGAAGPYRFALEVLEGGLPRLGIGEGSVLKVGGSCPSSP